MKHIFLHCLVILPVAGQTVGGGFSSLAAYSGILSDTAQAQSDTRQPDAAPAPGHLTSPGVDVAPAYKPYTAGQKFKAASHNVFGPVALVAVGFSAGIDQLTDTPSEWRQGAEAYGKRYASEFGDNAAHQYFGFILQSAFHEDPRYFPSADRSTKARIKSVIRQTFLAHKDSGGEQFAFARWGSALGAGLLSDVWQPRSTGHLHNGLTEGGILFGADIGFDLAEEFIPFFRHLHP
jgi:hypothetical protein